MLLVLLAACAPPVAEPADPDRVKAVLLPYLAFAPLFIAEEEGYFQDRNIEMEYIQLSSGQEALPALLQGDIDINMPTLNAGVINAVARGGRTQIVGSIVRFDNNDCVYSGLIGRQGFDLSSKTADEQLRVATNPAGTEGFYTDVWLNGYSDSLGDAKIEDLPPPALAEALAGNAMDLVHTSEPWLTRLLDGGDVELLAAAKDVIPGLEFAVIMYGPDLLVERPDVGRRFMAAYLQGVKQFNEGKTARNLDILQKYTELDRDLLERICWPTIPADGALNTETVMTFQQWALDRNLIDAIVPVEELYDASYVEWAAEQ
ncbi:MAG: ABC transporter substrate-binding protein [Caldilineales bacterium]|nr:ABC transporter substrate-binding protein [Caldilineales bacterium]